MARDTAQKKSAARRVSLYVPRDYMGPTAAARRGASQAKTEPEDAPAPIRDEIIRPPRQPGLRPERKPMPRVNPWGAGDPLRMTDSGEVLERSTGPEKWSDLGGRRPDQMEVWNPYTGMTREQWQFFRENPDIAAWHDYALENGMGLDQLPPEFKERMYEADRRLGGRAKLRMV